MSSDMKFVGGIVVASVLLLAGIFVFSKKNSDANTDVAKHISASSLEDAGQMVRPDSYRKGNVNGKVTLVEFGDYQCPACKAAEPEVTKIVEDYSEKLNFVFRHFPLPSHSYSQVVATAVEAAGAQEKYWEMHSKLFETQDEWASASIGRIVDLMVGYATEIGIDAERFRTALVERQFDEKIGRDLADAEKIGVSSTPSFYVNGNKVDLSGLRQAIDNALK